MDNQLPTTDHSLIVIESGDNGGTTIIAGGGGTSSSNIVRGDSVLESLSEAEEDDDGSSSTTDGCGRDEGHGGGDLDSGCCSTKAENSDVSSLSGGFGGKNEQINGGTNFNHVGGVVGPVSGFGSVNPSSSNAAMAAAMASAMAMMTPTSPRSVTTAGSMHSASGRQRYIFFLKLQW